MTKGRAMRLAYLAAVVVLTVHIPLGLAQITVKAPEPSPPQAGRQVLQHAAGFDYWVYLPQDYEQQKAAPLVIFLHGINPKDITDAIVETPGARVNAGQQFPFVLVSPYWRDKKWWSSDELLVLINVIATRYKIDPQRIYLTGFSMGGIATWDLASRHPEYFAAIVPLAGDGNVGMAVPLKNVPVWAFHGAKDDTVRMQGEQQLVNALKAAGAEVKYTVLPNKGHVVRRDAYDDPAVYEWLLLHRKATAAPIDPLAELRYEVRHNLRVNAQPLIVDSDTVGDVAGKLDLHNSLPSPIQVRGNMTAAGLQIRPAEINLSLAPGASQTLAFEVVGGQTPVAGATPISIKWTATAHQPDHPEITVDFERHLPISRMQTCPKLSGSIAVDGDLSEWSKANWIPIVTATAKKNAASTQPSARAAMSVAYDEQAVYLAVRVEDKHVHMAPQKPVWEQDGIEARFDFRPSPRGDSFQDWQDVLPILVSPDEEADAPTIWQPETLPAGTRVVSKLTATGYDTEIAIPLSYATKKQGGPLRQFRLNLCINDTDGKKPVAKIWWHPDWRSATADDGVGTFLCAKP